MNEKIWGLPEILAAKVVYVKRPGKQALDPINNPLYLYTMPKADLVKEKDRVQVNWARKGMENLVRLAIDLTIDMTQVELIPPRRPQQPRTIPSGHPIRKEKPISTILKTKPA